MDKKKKILIGILVGVAFLNVAVIMMSRVQSIEEVPEVSVGMDMTQNVEDESGDSGEGENGLKEAIMSRETEGAEIEQESSPRSSAPEEPDEKVAETAESGNSSSYDTVWQGLSAETLPGETQEPAAESTEEIYAVPESKYWMGDAVQTMESRSEIRSEIKDRIIFWDISELPEEDQFFLLVIGEDFSAVIEPELVAKTADYLKENDYPSSVSIRLTNFGRNYANLGYTFDLVIDEKNTVPAFYGGEMGINRDLRFVIDPLPEETEDVIDEGDYVRDRQ